MITTIALPAQTEDSLFDGIDAGERAGIDAPASVDAYHTEWERRVAAAFPGAVITVGIARRVEVFGTRSDDGQEFSDAEGAIQEIGEALFNDGDRWMVDAGPAPHHPYAARFPRVVEVSTAHELFAWTETHPIIEWSEWPVDVYQNTGDPNEAAFILAVPTPAGMVGFFAPTEADADKIRAGVF